MINKTIVSEARTTKEEIDDRIKRLSRKFLCDMAPERDKMLGLREYYWAMSEYLAECGDYIDRELRKKRRRNPKWKRDRPKPSEIRAEEDQLKSFIGHDIEKLELIEQFEAFLSLVTSDPIKAQPNFEQASDSLNGKKLQYAVRVFTRGRGGAPNKHNDAAKAADKLLKEGKTIRQAARIVWPDLFRNDPDTARNRLKTLVYRYRKQHRQEPRHARASAITKNDPFVLR